MQSHDHDNSNGERERFMDISSLEKFCQLRQSTKVTHTYRCCKVCLADITYLNIHHCLTKRHIIVWLRTNSIFLLQCFVLNDQFSYVHDNSYGEIERFMDIFFWEMLPAPSKHKGKSHLHVLQGVRGWYLSQRDFIAETFRQVASSSDWTYATWNCISVQNQPSHFEKEKGWVQRWQNEVQQIYLIALRQQQEKTPSTNNLEGQRSTDSSGKSNT